MVDAVKPGGAEPLSPPQAKLKKACQEFEAMFLRYLLEKMRESVPKDGIEEESSEKQLYESMLDSAMADAMSQQGQLGLADLLYEQVAPSIGNSGAQGAAALAGRSVDEHPEQ